MSSRRWKFWSWKEPGHEPIHRGVEMVALPAALHTDEERIIVANATTAKVTCLNCQHEITQRPSLVQAALWWSALVKELDESLMPYDRLRRK